MENPFFEQPTEEVPDEPSLPEKPIVIGKLQEEKKKEISEEYHERFSSNEFKEDDPEKQKELEIIRSIEVEKTPEEIILIQDANKYLNETMQRLGIKPFDISAERIIFYDNKKGKELGIRIAGRTSGMGRYIIIPDHRREDPVDLAGVIYHEMTHLKGYYALEAYEGEVKTKVGEKIDADSLIISKIYSVLEALKPGSMPRIAVYKNIPTIKTGIYRGGLAIKYPHKKKDRLDMEEHEYGGSFGGLNEALVATMEMEFEKEYVKKENIQLDEYDKRHQDDSAGYPGQRMVLNLLINGIYEKNKEKFTSKNEVLDVFIKAHFDGKILNMSKLIVNSFNLEVFKKVAEMDKAPWSSKGVLDLIENKATSA